MKYNFAGMEELAARLNSNFNQLESLAGVLQSEVTRLHSNWQSEQASESYGIAQQRWDTSFSDSRMLLDTLSARVVEAADTMRGADARTANFFR